MTNTSDTIARLRDLIHKRDYQRAVEWALANPSRPVFDYIMGHLPMLWAMACPQDRGRRGMIYVFHAWLHETWAPVAAVVGANINGIRVVHFQEWVIRKPDSPDQAVWLARDRREIKLADMTESHRANLVNDLRNRAEMGNCSYGHYMWWKQAIESCTPPEPSSDTDAPN